MKRALLALSLAALALVAFAASTSAPAAPSAVGIRIHYSHFEPNAIEVPVGVPITFVLRNDDPIDHEWLIGDAAFHARHRTGTEAVHGDRPNEVSLPALTTKTTTMTFDTPGQLTFVCHFPGHEAYGMVGLLTVR